MKVTHLLNSFLSILLIVTATHGESPTVVSRDAPITQPEMRWLDLAQNALGQWVSQADDQARMFQDDAACALVRVRGDDSDKAIVRKIIALPPIKQTEEGKKIFKMTEAQWNSRLKIGSVPLYIAIGETEKARQLMKDGRKEMDQAGKVEILDALGLDNGLILRSIMAINQPEEDKETLENEQFHDYFNLADRIGRHDLCNKMLDKAIRLANEEFSKTAPPAIETDIFDFKKLQVAELSEHLVMEGRVVEAENLIVRLNKIKKYKASRAMINCAEVGYRLNRIDLGDSFLNHAIENMDDADSSTHGIIRTARNFGRQSILEKAIETRLKFPFAVGIDADLPQLFRFACMTSDKDLIQKCDSAISEFKNKISTDEDYYKQYAKYLADCEMVIAAGYANSNRIKEMYDAIDRANAIFTPEDHSNTEGMPYLLEDLAQSGKDDIAESLAKKYYKNPHDSDHFRIESAIGHIERGELNAAFDQASKMIGREGKRHLLLSHVIYRLHQLNQFSDAESKFNSITSARDRAIIALTVADLINGKRQIGMQIPVGIYLY